MNNNELLNVIKDYKDIVIFGASKIGNYLYELITTNNDSIVSYCDNKKSIQDSNKKIYCVEDAIRKHPKALFLISSAVYFEVMKEQLIYNGVNTNNIILAFTEEMQLKFDIKYQHSPLKKIKFEVDLVCHCNLNCNCCSQFSSIANEEYADVNIVKKDLERMGEIFEHTAERIYLIGGEPLLHKDINGFLDIARESFSNSTICIYTNGLLLSKSDPEFWEKCRRNNIEIIVTKYPINFDYNVLLETAKKEKIKLSFIGNSEDFKYMMNLKLNLEGNCDIQESFDYCYEANNCIKLKDGKLFTCTRPASIYKFNKYFDKNLVVSDEDYIDIYQKDITAEEIFKKLSNPIPFCRYCNMRKMAVARQWGPTQGKIEEWL